MLAKGTPATDPNSRTALGRHQFRCSALLAHVWCAGTWTSGAPWTQPLPAQGAVAGCKTSLAGEAGPKRHRIAGRSHWRRSCCRCSHRCLRRRGLRGGPAQNVRRTAEAGRAPAERGALCCTDTCRLALHVLQSGCPSDMQNFPTAPNPRHLCGAHTGDDPHAGAHLRLSNHGASKRNMQHLWDFWDHPERL